MDEPHAHKTKKKMMDQIHGFFSSMFLCFFFYIFLAQFPPNAAKIKIWMWVFDFHDETGYQDHNKKKTVAYTKLIWMSSHTAHGPNAS